MLSSDQHQENIYHRARKLMPAGIGGQSQYRPPHPIYLRRAKGSRVYDMAGHEYIDYMIGAGSLSLGHAHPTVVRAVQKALKASVPNLAATEDQLEFAARLQRYFPSMERIRFTPSGTEANQVLIRLARAFSGRDRIERLCAFQSIRIQHCLARGEGLCHHARRVRKHQHTTHFHEQPGRHAF